MCKPPRGGALGDLVRGLADVENRSRLAERIAAEAGVLQALDPRIKVAAALVLIVATAAAHSLTMLALPFALAVGLALTSGVGRSLWRVWAGVAVFTGLAVLPALFLVPGTAVGHLPVLGWAVTQQGLRSAALIFSRAEIAATYTSLLVLTTPWPHVLKALSCLRIPAAVIAVLGMTYRHIFILLETAGQMTEARRARLLAPLDAKGRRRLTLATMGGLLSKTMVMGAEVHEAMIARGYRGEVRLLHDFRTRPADWAALAVAFTVSILILWGAR